jgi:peptidoglycan glycosyltransferase
LLDRPDAPKHTSFLLLLAPIALVASLVGLRALAEGVTVQNPALPEPVRTLEIATADSGLQETAVVASGSVEDDEESEGASDDEAATFDGHIPSIATLAPYPEAEDLLAQAHTGKDGRFYVTRAGREQALTIDPILQAKVESLLKTYAPPYAAIAAIEPATGRVLALVQYSKDAPGVRQLGLRAVYPAASVFKVVTAAALLENGVDPSREVCFHGGKHRIQQKLLENSARDRTCLDMGSAMAKSANVVFAKLAHQNLKPEQLRVEAAKFGFNRELAFDQPLEKSAANIPEAPFEFATTAAGFGQVFLSPLHGALLAASVGNRGSMPSPTLLEDGADARAPHQILEPKVAAELAEMMAQTISGGTARKAFRERGRPVMKGIEVAGKTGSLDDKHPFHDYTWFVGFAPKEQPRIAVAAVVVNNLVWRVRAPYLARETLRTFFDEGPRKPHAQARR